MDRCDVRSILGCFHYLGARERVMIVSQSEFSFGGIVSCNWLGRVVSSSCILVMQFLFGCVLGCGNQVTGLDKIGDSR